MHCPASRSQTCRRTDAPGRREKAAGRSRLEPMGVVVAPLGISLACSRDVRAVDAPDPPAVVLVTRFASLRVLIVLEEAAPFVCDVEVMVRRGEPFRRLSSRSISRSNARSISAGRSLDAIV